MLRPDDQRLETRRLILRRPELSDAASITMLIGNWDVVKMLGRVPYPYPDNAAVEWVTRTHRSTALGQQYAFGICEKAKPLEGVVGVVGLTRDDDGTWEIGYWLGEPFWGQGYMGEATPEVIRFAFEVLGLERIEAGHFVGNPGSARVLLRSGFEYVGEERRWSEARGHDVDCLKLELTRAKWAAYNHRAAAE